VDLKKIERKHIVIVTGAAAAAIGLVLASYGLRSCNKHEPSPTGGAPSSESSAAPEEAKTDNPPAVAAVKSEHERQCLALVTIKDCRHVTAEEWSQCNSSPDTPEYLACPPGVLVDVQKKLAAGTFDVCCCKYVPVK
jgi:hypothetical protein